MHMDISTGIGIMASSLSGVVPSVHCPAGILIFFAHLNSLRTVCFHQFAIFAHFLH